MQAVRVVSFNIHKGLSVFGIKKTLAEIKELLEIANPDIICLQEIGSRFVPDSENFESQLEFLADSVWANNSYVKNATYPKGHHGNAILSRWPIIDAKTFDLTLHGLEQRGLVHAIVESQKGEKIHVLSVHLNLLARDRKKQVAMMDHYLKENVSSEEVVICSGDFNDWRSEVNFEFDFKEAFLESCGRYAKTFPSFYPFLTLDRIYYRNLQVLKTNILKVRGFQYVSDHLAICADLKVV